MFFLIFLEGKINLFFIEDSEIIKLNKCWNNSKVLYKLFWIILFIIFLMLYIVFVDF